MMARVATRDLTRLGLVLAPGVVRGRRLGQVALAVGGVALGAAVMHLADGGWPQLRHAIAPSAVAASGPSPLQQALDQSQLTLRVAESRSQELERQIATLVQQLRDAQEELTFFRKTKEPKAARGGAATRERRAVAADKSDTPGESHVQAQQQQ